MLKYRTFFEWWPQWDSLVNVTSILKVSSRPIGKFGASLKHQSYSLVDKINGQTTIKMYTIMLQVGL